MAGESSADADEAEPVIGEGEGEKGKRKGVQWGGEI